MGTFHRSLVLSGGVSGYQTVSARDGATGSVPEASAETARMRNVRLLERRGGFPRDPILSCKRQTFVPTTMSMVPLRMQPPVALHVRIPVTLVVMRDARGCCELGARVFVFHLKVGAERACTGRVGAKVETATTLLRKRPRSFFI